MNLIRKDKQRLIAVLQLMGGKASNEKAYGSYALI